MALKNKKSKLLFTIISVSFLAVTVIAITLWLRPFKSKDYTFYLEDKYYNKTELTPINKAQLQKLESSNESFVTLVHTPGHCSAPVPFEPLVKEFAQKNNVSFYETNFRDIKGTKARQCAKFSPSVVIYKQGEVVSCLDAVSDDDLPYYMSVDGFSTWFTKYVNLKE